MLNKKCRDRKEEKEKERTNRLDIEEKWGENSSLSTCHYMLYVEMLYNYL